MNRALWALALVSGTSLAQPGSESGSTWTGVEISRAGNELAIELALRDSGSVWKYVPKGAQRLGNPCLGRAYPATATGDPGSDIQLRVEASKALAGCPDFSVNLKRIDDKTLEGSFADGRPLKLVR